MSTFFRPLFAAMLVAGATLATPVLAQAPAPAQAPAASSTSPQRFVQGYPRVTGSGESLSIEYGPMGHGTLVGGGRVMVTTHAGMDVDFMHFDVQFAQQPREGFVPLTIGSGESAEIVWVPQAMLTMMRNARSSMPRR
jgi:hypothetical protein